MSYVIPVWDMPSIQVAGRSERFPVRHIYCVGRNYSEHAKEMGVKLPPQLDDPNAELTPQLIIEVLRDICWHYFPLLAPEVEVH